MASRIRTSLPFLSFLAWLLPATLMLADANPGTAQDRVEKAGEPGREKLPFVAGFEPARYLGKWYEVARLPVAYQPDDTLAVAEYSATQEGDKLVVKNTAYNAKGELVSTIQGEARLAAGEPPGRLLVAFGPQKPSEPNYYVIHIDKYYRHAVVGVPDRKSLWVLAREVPISLEKLDELRQVAKNAGFDVSKLLVAPWAKVKPLDLRKP